jgi:hypothetical protein
VSRTAFATLTACVAIGLAASSSAEEAPKDLLRRQTQELFDALGKGDKAVWEKYLDPEVRYVDESGVVAGKKGDGRRHPGSSRRRLGTIR